LRAPPNRAGRTNQLVEAALNGAARGGAPTELIQALPSPENSANDLMLRKCFENGLLLLSCGDSTIRFCPPLITTSEQIEVGLEIFLDVLKTVAG